MSPLHCGDMQKAVVEATVTHNVATACTMDTIIFLEFQGGIKITKLLDTRSINWALVERGSSVAQISVCTLPCLPIGLTRFAKPYHAFIGFRKTSPTVPSPGPLYFINVCVQLTLKNTLCTSTVVGTAQKLCHGIEYEDRRITRQTKIYLDRSYDR